MVIIAAGHRDLLGPFGEIAESCAVCTTTSELTNALSKNSAEGSVIIHVEAYNPVKFLLARLQAISPYEGEGEELLRLVEDFEKSASQLRKQVITSGFRIVPIMYEELLFRQRESHDYLKEKTGIRTALPDKNRLTYYALELAENRSLVDVINRSCFAGALEPTLTLEEEELLAAKRTLREAEKAWTDGVYYESAEQWIDNQWESIVAPLIANSDLSVTIDLACGHGRAVPHLSKYAQRLYLLDLSSSALEFTHRRFGDQIENCQLNYIQTNGTRLDEIASASVSFICCWDAAVHFDKLTVKEYVAECARALSAGGTALFHHSNFGNVQRHAHWRDNPHWRSNMTVDLFRQYCESFGLVVTEQRLLDWGPWEGATYPDLDCVSLLQKLK